MKKITVLGMGYIGLPTALLLANPGHRTFGFDIDENKVTFLKNGKLPFEESGLDKFFSEVKKNGNFIPVSNIQPSDFFIIAVPTPQKENKKADLKYVFSAIEKIKQVLKSGDTIILESTVGPIDSEKEIIPFIEKFNKKIHFAHCPERAIPGNTLFEMVNNDRIIGVRNKEDGEIVKRLYSTFVKGQIFVTTPNVAASVKVMENTYRDVNIALANEFAKIAEDLRFNVWEAIKLANHHPRVDIHQPGPGVGGHCIPIDPWFFVGESTHAELSKKARMINDSMPEKIAEDVERIIEKLKLKNVTIAILGFAYKKNVDDAREAPAKQVCELLSKKYKVFIHDFYVKNNPKVTNDFNKALKQSEIAVLVTDHDGYKKTDFSNYPNLKAIYDSRNFFTEDDFAGTEIKIYTLGKPQ